MSNWTWILGSLLVLGGSGPLAAAAADDDQRIKEIVVTAQKVSSTLMETPAAVSAFDSEQLESAVIRDINDISMLEPNLIISQELVSKVFLRGVGTENLTSGGDPGVALHVDGVYVARTSAANFDLYDIERVEVLKGPQGTLYGRNATGGAINIISRAPTNDFGGDARVEFGNYDHIRVGGTLNLPLVDNKLLGRINVVHSRRDGYTKNYTTGVPLDDEDLDAARLRLRYLPTDALAIDVTADYSDSDNRQAPFKIMEEALSIFELPPFDGYDPADRRHVAHDVEDVMDQRQKGVAVEVNWDLGAASLTSVTGYRDTHFYSLFDGDSTDRNYQNFDDHSDFTQYSQELRLASGSPGPLRWVAGVYYFNDRGTSQVFIEVPGFGFNIDHQARLKTEAYAVFGQATYSITERLRLTAGLRYSNEERRARQTSDFGDGNPPAFQDMRRDDSAWTPKYGIEYSLDDGTLLYANLTKGFKSGGFVFNGFQPAYSPETVWVWDAGLKAGLFDGRMQARVAAFYYDYSNMQVSVFENFVGTIKNAADATIYGTEVEIAARPMAGLDVNLALSLLHTEYDEFVTQDPTMPSVPSIDLAGNHLPRSPDFSATLGIQYTQPLPTLGSLVYRVDYRHQDESYFNPFNRDRSRQESLDLLDARISLVSDDGSWELAAYGKNLGNKLYYTTILESAVEIGRPFGILAAPRTYGIQAAYHF